MYPTTYGPFATFETVRTWVEKELGSCIFPEFRGGMLFPPKLERIETDADVSMLRYNNNSDLHRMSARIHRSERLQLLFAAHCRQTYTGATNARQKRRNLKVAN